MEAIAKKWEKCVKQQLKPQRGEPMKLKKLLKVMQAALGSDAAVDQLDKDSLKGCLATMPKVTLEDGLCWWGSRAGEDEEGAGASASEVKGDRHSPSPYR